MKMRKWLLSIALVVILILLIPTILSTSIGKNTITNIASEISGFNISAENLSLGWIGPQKLENIRGKSLEKGLNFDIDSIEIDRGLFRILTSFSLGKVNVKKPVFYIQPKQLKAALSEENLIDEDSESLNYDAFELPFDRLTINDGSFRIVNLDGTITRIDQGSVQLERKDELVTFGISGTSVEKEIKGTFRIDSVFDLNSIQTPHSITAEVINFPTQVIDEVIEVFHQELILKFRELLGPSLNFSLDHQNEHYNISIGSEFLNGSGTLEKQGEFFKAIKPLSLTWNGHSTSLNPLFQRLEIPVSMKDDVNVQFTLFDLVGNPLEFKSSFKTEMSPTSLTLNEDGSLLKLDSLSVNSKVNVETDKREVTGLGLLNFNGTPFNMNIRGETQLGLSAPICLEDCLKGQWSIFLEKIPTKLIQLLFNEEQALDTIVGPNISLNLGLAQRRKETIIGFRLYNEAISSNSWFQFILGHSYLKLKKPVEVQFQPLNPIPFTIDGTPYVINPKTPLILNLDALELPRNFEPYYTSISATLKSDEIAFGETPLELSKLNLSFKKKKFSKLEVGAKTDVKFLEQFKTYLGEVLSLKSNASIYIPKEGKWSTDLVTLDLSSDKLKAVAEASITDDFKLHPISNIQVEYITSAIPFEKLLQPSTLNLEVYSSSTMIDLANLGNSRFKGKLNGSTLVIQERNGSIVSLDNLEMPFFGNIPEDVIQVSLKGRTGVAGNDNRGYLNLNLEITDLYFANEFSLSHACYNGKFNLEKFPSLFLSPILGVYPILGEQFNAQIEGKLLCNQDPTGSMTFNLDSDTLNIDTRFKMDQQLITMYSNPLEQNVISFNLNREEATKVFPSALGIQSGIDAKIVLENLTLPNLLLAPPALFDFINQLHGTGKIQISSIEMTGYKTPELAGNFKFGSEDEPISIKVQDKNGEELELQLLLDRPLENIEHWTDLDIETFFHGKNIPLDLLAYLADVDPVVKEYIEVLFDNHAEIRLNMNIQDQAGPLDLLVRGSNCALEVPGIVEGRNLKLTAPLTLTMNVTPQIGASIIGELVPLLATTLSASEPITLTIQPEGFLLPLDHLDQLQIAQGELKLGTISLGVDKDIEEVLNFLKFNAGNIVEAQATPVYFNIQNQVVNLERFDFLVAKQFPMALWGKIDFKKNNVNLKLGLGAGTLENVFDIRHLPSNFMLPLNLKGTLDDVNLDKSKATAKIAALIAESKGSPEGLLLGNLIQLLSGSFKEEAAPPPTTDPLPWAKEKDSPEKPKEPTEIKKALKSIEEGAKSLFKKLK